MRTFFVCVVAVLALSAGLTWSAEAPDLPPGVLNEVLERADRGEPLNPDQLALVERFARDHLFRVKCGTLEDAQFSLAQLQVKAERGQEAVETLRKLADATRSEDVRSAAQYDIGKVYMLALNNVKAAAEAFQKVTGRFEPLAKRELLRMYEQGGQAGKAVEFLQAAAAAAKDKGEKLALLRQLGELCRRAGKTEDAIAAYRQITDEFTEKDMDEIRAASAKRVKDAFDKCLALYAERRWPDADAVLLQMKVWIGQLAAAGRTDEFETAQDEMVKGFRAMEDRERKAQDDKKKEKPKEEAGAK